MAKLERQRERKERDGDYIYPRCCTHSMKRVYECKNSSVSGKKAFTATGWRCSVCNKYIDDTHPDIKDKMVFLEQRRETLKQNREKKIKANPSEQVK